MNPELRFVAACCRWPDDELRRARVSAFAEDVGDWERVAALTGAHRVEGLVRNAIRSASPEVPAGVAVKIEAMAEAVRGEALQAVSETLRLGRLLAERGIAYRILKGSPVAAIAYGTVTMKNSVDIDLLVPRDDVVRTAALLREAGYDQARPWRTLDETEFQSWAVVAKEACFISDRAQVDLHWDLLDQPELLTGLDAWADPMTVPLIGEAGVPTLPPAVHLAYLAGHGAMSGWSRLKWLADFAAFIAVHPQDRRERLCSEARRMTGGRPVDQGLILAEWLLGGGLPAPDQEDLPATQRLAKIACAIIESRRPDIAIEKMWRPVRLLSHSQWGLKRGIAYRIAEARRRSKEQEIRFRLRWPVRKSLQWLYMPLRLPGAMLGRAVLIWRAARRGTD